MGSEGWRVSAGCVLGGMFPTNLGWKAGQAGYGGAESRVPREHDNLQCS